MTVRRAALAAGLVAALLYAPALGNGIALDDSPIVERNPAAHSVRAALAALTRPYWPPEHEAGLWRPLVTLSFAVDWQASDGSQAVLHATNVLLHGAVTALLVPLLAAFVTVPAALAGALVFAVHPVHVEAVANLVGRAELLAALWLLAAMLLARRIRSALAGRRRTWHLEVSLLFAVILALLSKEHAAICVALLWLDEKAQPNRGALPARDYLAVLALTAAWFVAHQLVERGLAFGAVAPTFVGLDSVGRLSTMLPVVLVVVRLLVWPFDLSPDYHPRVVERLEHPTALGLAGLLMLLALLMLAVLLWRSGWAASRGPLQPAATGETPPGANYRIGAALGLLIIGLGWLPTSNLLFPSGIVLSERTLYFSTVGLALLAALAAQAASRRWTRGTAAVVLVVLLPLAWRAVTQIPVWRSTKDLVISALVSHPESYRVHQSAARVLERLHLRDAAIREYQMAVELYPADHLLLTELGGTALAAGKVRLALECLRRSERLDTDYSLTHQLLANALIQADSPRPALAEARMAVRSGPTKPEAARMLAASFVALRWRDSALAVWPAFAERGGSRFERWLLSATTYAALGLADSALWALDSATIMTPDDTLSRRRLRDARREVTRLAPIRFGEGR